ncbi:MAG: Glu-tRNA(Gln) amidotransferase GatDE subunit E, partial [Candidatus Pacearchaeota archaeon]|nr:Glu-tRNA(Gln) amidotransferase GatDE subunit E [Candidatus Pacearchaeota archaeon]
MVEEKIELKSGLEIHQQLDSCKLFCSCPSILRTDPPDYIIERELHAVAGETGEIDEAVKFESSRDRKFTYQCYYDNNCLVELDESPPNEINPEALRIALQLALLLNCEIIQDTQIMRKTVVDGSNTSGFQRTLLIAKNGYIETSLGKVGIQSICLEEDAARIVENDKNRVIYRLDR